MKDFKGIFRRLSPGTSGKTPAIEHPQRLLAPVLVYVLGVACPQAGNAVLLAFNITGEHARWRPVTVTLVVLTAGAVSLWVRRPFGRSRPSFRQDGRMWRRALIMGAAATAGLISSVWALNLNVPLATVGALSLITGPMANATVRFIQMRRWSQLAWPGLAIIAGFLVISPAAEGFNPLAVGLACVPAVGYHINITFFERMKKAGEDLDAASAMTRTMQVPLVFLVFLFVGGKPAELTQHGWLEPAIIGLAGILIAGLSASLYNAAWRRDLPATTMSILTPAAPAFGALFGLLAGQFLTAWQGLGIALVVTIGVGAALTRKDEPDPGTKQQAAPPPEGEEVPTVETEAPTPPEGEEAPTVMTAAALRRLFEAAYADLKVDEARIEARRAKVSVLAGRTAEAELAEAEREAIKAEREADQARRTADAAQALLDAAREHQREVRQEWGHTRS